MEFTFKRIIETEVGNLVAEAKHTTVNTLNVRLPEAVCELCTIQMRETITSDFTFIGEDNTGLDLNTANTDTNGDITHFGCMCGGRNNHK